MKPPLQERSIATRLAILDAALECLDERGYAGTTTIAVARRAGVSRGAQLHHFATKAELMAAAVEHLMVRRVEDFRKAFANMDTGVSRLDATVDLMWSMYQGPTFAVWAELSMAARTDPDLAKLMIEVDRQFATQANTVYEEVFPADLSIDPELGRIARDFAFALMDGVAFERLVPRPGRRPAREYVDILTMIYRLFVPSDPGDVST